MTRYQVVAGESEVVVRASSNLHAITMRSTDVSGWFEPDAGRGEIELRVDSLHSENPLYDREGARRLDAARYPVITGRLLSCAPRTDGPSDAHGEITFHGATRPVEGELSVTASGDGAVVIEGTREFDVRQWGVKPPRLLMLKVHPDALVRIRLVARILTRRTLRVS